MHTQTKRGKLYRLTSRAKGMQILCRLSLKRKLVFYPHSPLYIRVPPDLPVRPRVCDTNFE